LIHPTPQSARPREPAIHRTWLPVLIAFFLLAPVSVSGEEVPFGQRQYDIPFVEGGGHDQQLDLYAPGAPNFPTILFIHEGGLTAGDRKDEPYQRMCRTFQDMGIACAAANYRLAPGHRWPAQPDDVAAAFAWLKRHIIEYGGDPRRIFLFGHSSGGLLAAIVAADSAYLARQGLRPADVAGVIAMGSRLNDVVEVRATPPVNYETSWVPADRVAEFMKDEPAFTDLAQRNDAVPASHVSGALPPTLVLIAEAERYLPPVLRDAAEFVGRARDAGAEADLAILADRTHMSAIRSMVTPDDPAVVRVAGFVRAH